MTGKSSSTLPERLANKLGNPATAHLFPYTNPEEIFNEHRETTRGRDLDITGLSYGHLETRRLSTVAVSRRSAGWQAAFV